MKTPKYSPGPWKARFENRIWKIGNKDANVCIIAHAFDPKRDKEANARLIASAPDLVKALLEIESICTADGDELSIQLAKIAGNDLEKAGL